MKSITDITTNHLAQNVCFGSHVSVAGGTFPKLALLANEK